MWCRVFVVVLVALSSMEEIEEWAKNNYVAYLPSLFLLQIHLQLAGLSISSSVWAYLMIVHEFKKVKQGAS